MDPALSRMMPDTSGDTAPCSANSKRGPALLPAPVSPDFGVPIPKDQDRLVSAACATRAGKGMRVLRRSPGPWPPLPKELPPPVAGGPLRRLPRQPRSLAGQIRFAPWHPAIACALASACDFGLRLRGASIRSFQSAFAALRPGASGFAHAIPSAGMLRPSLARCLPIPISIGCPRPGLRHATQKGHASFRTV
jgi:hypothetical protein